MRTIGDLRHKVAVQRREVNYTDGRQVNAWVTIYEGYAEILHASAREFAKAGGNYAETVSIIHLRNPVAFGLKLDSGLRILEANGDAWEALEIVYDKPKRGFVEVRARKTEMEGYGA